MKIDYTPMMTHRERDLRAVCLAGHLVFNRLRRQKLSGLTEVQVAQQVKGLYRDLGITQLAFPTFEKGDGRGASILAVAEKEAPPGQSAHANIDSSRIRREQ